MINEQCSNDAAEHGKGPADIENCPLFIDHCLLASRAAHSD
jgi:hypothetical protein